MEFDPSTLIVELQKLDKLAKIRLVSDEASNAIFMALNEMDSATLAFLAQKCVMVYRLRNKYEKEMNKTDMTVKTQLDNNMRPEQLIVPILDDSFGSDKYKPGAFGYKSPEHQPKTPGIISPTGKAYKVVPCKYYTTPGGCKKGENCPYSHNEDERQMNKMIVYGHVNPDTVFGTGVP